jgi:CRISPR-associated protein Cmr4
MPYTHKLVLYQTITPLHVGCGQDVGVVDLPVIRERTTGYPFIPGSGIRGAVRELFGESDATSLLFGPTAEEDQEPRYAGCVSVHDAKVLLFPVRSDHQVFLWITCPHVLQRFTREIEAFDTSGPKWQPPATSPGADQVAGSLPPDAPVFLEEFRYTAVQDGTLATWAATVESALGPSGLASRSVLVADESFTYFVRHATLIQQHNRLSSAKTVEAGALFSVEAVPPETVFYGFFGATDARRPAAEGESRKPRGEVLKDLRAGTREYLHLGGDEGTGLGLTRLAWVD